MRYYMQNNDEPMQDVETTDTIPESVDIDEASEESDDDAKEAEEASEEKESE